MKVLFIDQYSEPGGAQRCLLEIVQGVVEHGWGVHAALPGNGALVRMIEAAGSGVTRIHCGPFASGHKTAGDAVRFATQFPLLVSQISRLVDAHSPDVVYVNGPRPLPAACIAARRGKVLFHTHSLLPPNLARVVSKSLSLPAAAQVIAGSRFVAAPLAGLLPAEMVRVIYNGVPDCASPRFPDGTGPRVGVLGRIAPEKGQLVFLKAARILAGRAPGVRLLIFGRPMFSNSRYDAAVREAASGLPVEFPGWREDVREALSRLDLLVVPSCGAESTTRVVLEAFSAGVPVVAFAAGGIPEIVEDQRTGFLVRDRTPEALAGAIEDLLHRPEETRLAAERARVAWERGFTVSRFQEQILGAMERLISPSCAVPRP